MASPDDVGTNHPRRLQAIVDILAVWESEIRGRDSSLSTSAVTKAEAGPLSIAQRACRLRVEFAARALIADSCTVEESVIAAGLGCVGGTDPGAAADVSMLTLSREWWPKLISAAVRVRAWEFLCRWVGSRSLDRTGKEKAKIFSRHLKLETPEIMSPER